MREIIARFDDEDKSAFVYGQEVGEIIRCKDCHFYKEDNLQCMMHDGDTCEWYENDFCSLAERKYAVTLTRGRAKAKNVAKGKKAYTADTSVLKVEVMKND